MSVSARDSEIQVGQKDQKYIFVINIKGLARLLNKKLSLLGAGTAITRQLGPYTENEGTHKNKSQF